MEEAKGKEEIQIGTELECTVVTAISHSHKQFAPHLPIQSILKKVNVVSRCNGKCISLESCQGLPYLCV